VTIPKLEYSHDNELDAALVEATDRRVSDWTYLQLMRMNQKFVARMRRHHGDLEVPPRMRSPITPNGDWSDRQFLASARNQPTSLLERRVNNGTAFRLSVGQLTGMVSSQHLNARG
jgi:hypothetical protein